MHVAPCHLRIVMLVLETFAPPLPCLSGRGEYKLKCSPGLRLVANGTTHYACVAARLRCCFSPDLVAMVGHDWTLLPSNFLLNHSITQLLVARTATVWPISRLFAQPFLTSTATHAHDVKEAVRWLETCVRTSD